MLPDLLEIQNPRERRRIEKIISAVKKADQKQLFFHNGGDVDSYCDNLKMNVSEYVIGLIERYQRAEILDIGMGQGVFLTGLKILFRDRVRTTGVSLQEVDPRNYGHFLRRMVDEEIYEPIETVRFEPRFHTAFSVMSYEYFFDKARAMENIVNGLLVDGTAHIHNRKGFYDEEKIFDYLAKNGFEIGFDDSPGYPVVRVKRKFPSKIELREFYTYASET